MLSRVHLQEIEATLEQRDRKILTLKQELFER